MINIADMLAAQPLGDASSEVDASKPQAFNVADLPAVRAQIEQLTRDVAAGKMQLKAGDKPTEYASAPEASGRQDTSGRPPAIQRNYR